jgi:hypothetical protein
MRTLGFNRTATRRLVPRDLNQRRSPVHRNFAL